jgi:predicted cupin superfamily sugar epimerase
MERLDATSWVTALKLSPHPEGGYYKEVYRSAESVSKSALPERFSGDRNYCTSIYYLLRSGDFSAFHRIRSDEIWHFYEGDALDLHILHNGEYRHVVIGRDVAAGQCLQYVVPAGAWFASTPRVGAEYALLGCTVSPGFDFADFEMAQREELISHYPGAAAVVTAFTRV